MLEFSLHNNRPLLLLYSTNSYFLITLKQQKKTSLCHSTFNIYSFLYRNTSFFSFFLSRIGIAALCLLVSIPDGAEDLRQLLVNWLPVVVQGRCLKDDGRRSNEHSKSEDPEK